jgi:predicted Zn-dependent protease
VPFGSIGAFVTPNKGGFIGRGGRGKMGRAPIRCGTARLKQVAMIQNAIKRLPSARPWLRVGIGCLVMGLSTAASLAQSDGPSIIRDAEIEQLLREYTTPIFRAAGINLGAVKVILVGDRSFNAFVANGQKIFVNVGALMESKTPNEIIGVLAHESGHIAGGHLTRQRQELARAQIMSVAGMLVGAAAVASTGNGRGRVGADSMGVMGTILGPQELIRRSLLSYQRGEEQAADRAAVNYLNATGQSAKGMVTTFERFANDSLFRSSSVDPYLMSHPMPTERIANLETIAKQSPYYEVKDSSALQARHDLMRAKLYGFVGSTAEIGRRYPLSDTSLAARYARAIAAYRFGRYEDGLAQIDGLIAAQPGNAYFWELKGQALLEGGRAGQSIVPLRKAVALAPNGVPIRVLLGRALVATDGHTDEAISVLANATQRDEDSAEAFRFLAMAYDRKGDQPKAQLAAAQGFFVEGHYVEARTQADRAQKQFKEGSPGWLKADDILNYRPPKLD